MRVKKWLIDRYGNPNKWIKLINKKPTILDAGCGAGMSGFEYWSEHSEN